MSQKPIIMTCYLDVVSSWCAWAIPAWQELQQRYAEVATFHWKVALMDPASLPTSRNQCEWFYRRSGTIVGSPFMLNSGWMEEGLKNYDIPNFVAEAARDLGVNDDRAWMALIHAALREGRKIGRWEVATQVVADACRIDLNELRKRSESGEVVDRARASTKEFLAMQVNQRPTFVLENVIGDRAVFSGVWRVEPLIAAVESLQKDAAAYASWSAHCGKAPLH